MDYTIMSFAAEQNDISVSKIIKKLPKSLYQVYLRKKVPFKVKEVYYIGEKGKNIILPFTKADIVNYDKEFLSSFIEVILKKTETVSVYHDQEVRKYAEIYRSDCTWILNYILFPQIFKWTIRKLEIDYRKIRMIILDSKDCNLEYILKILIADLNYLTIVTDRKSYVEPIADAIYENTGLIIEITETPLREAIRGNVIIDLEPGGYKGYRYFDKNATVIDMNWTQEKSLFISSRRQDLRVAYGFLTEAAGQFLDNELIAEILRQKYPSINQLAEGKNKALSVQECQRLVEKYNFKVTNVKIMNG